MKIKSLLLFSVAAVSGYFAFYFYLNNELPFAVGLGTVALLFIGLFIKSLLKMKNPYQAELNKILRTYDSVLVEVEVMPKISDKKVVRTKFFKDMVNVQFEVRKPIYYLRGPVGCTFVIMNEDTAYIFELAAADFEVDNKE